MFDFYQRHKQRIDRAAFFALITVVVYVFFTVLFAYLGPFFIGLLIALLAEPMVRVVVRKLKWKRWIASIICLLIFIALLSSIGAWLVTTLIRQISAFVESAPVHVHEIGLRLNEFNLWVRRIEDFLPEGWYVPNIEEVLLSFITNILGEGVRDQGVRLATIIPNFFLNMIITLVSAHFFIADRQNIYNGIKKACPEWISKQMSQTRKGLSRAMGGYFRAQYILMLVVGVISVVGLLILGNQYALLLGLIFSVLDFLPIVGTGAVFVPWVLISVIMGNFRQAIGLAVIYGVITITRQIIQPKILGNQMGAHPLASLMSIFIGFRIFGLFGLIIGPSLLMIFIAIYETRQSKN